MEFDLSVGFTAGKKDLKVLGRQLPMTLASPSQQDSQHLLEKRHSRSDGVLIRGEAANAKTGSLSFLGNAQTAVMIIIINGHVSHTCLISLSFLPFVLQE